LRRESSWAAGDQKRENGTKETLGKKKRRKGALLGRTRTPSAGGTRRGPPMLKARRAGNGLRESPRLYKGIWTSREIGVVGGR